MYSIVGIGTKLLQNFTSKYFHKKNYIVGVGNILLDITVPVQDDVLLKKYNLKEDHHIEFNDDDMERLSKDIEGY